jgi:BirA family biotin operon repressor/biotin-[acetyl-CoA-carboxylase] ligase
MLTNHTVAEAARAAGIPVPARFLDVTGSTNSDVFEMAKHGAPEWTVLVAGQQEAGRGRLGRTWISTAPGHSLHVSVLLRPRIEPARAPLLSLLAGVAAVEALQVAAALAAKCKWPNDVVAGVRKLGGVLSEASVDGGRLDFVVIGAGLNVMQRPEDFPEELRGSATSVVAEGGLAEIAALLEAYLDRLHVRYENLGDVVEAYRPLCDSIGRMVKATTTDGTVIEGRAVAVGDDGQLLVETPAGLRPVDFGEVEHLR